MQEVKNRFDKLDKLKGKVDSIIILNEEENTDYFYFTNSSASGILFYDFSKPRIYTNKMEIEHAKNSWIKNIEIGKLDDVLKSCKNMNIGINIKKLDVAIYKKISKFAKIIDISDAIENARIIKTKYEIKCIKKSCKISEKAFLKTSTDKKSELEIAAEIEYNMKLCGSRPAFPTIVASGKNIRVPHHEPTIKKAKAPLLIDFGAKYNGYCSDITRTFGSRFENTILKVFDEVEKNLCPGAKASDIDAISRKTMGRYEKFFITGLGHGIGLDVHEKPWVSKNSTDILKEGMVFTIEPGIYVNNGIRIENDYLITKNSFKKITDF